MRPSVFPADDEDDDVDDEGLDRELELGVEVDGRYSVVDDRPIICRPRTRSVPDE